MTQNTTAQKDLKKETFFSILVRRIPVHLLGMTLGLLLSNLLLDHSDSNSTMVLTYIGIICLLSHGDWKKPTWYIPVLAGVAQILVTLVLGVPLGAAIFWGGLQAWLQRIWQKRGRLCWDWSVTPFLIACLDGISFGRSMTFTSVSIFVIFIAGIVANMVYSRLRAEQIHEEELKEDIATLEALLKETIKPQQVASQAKMLKMHAESLSKILTGRVREGYEAIARVRTCVNTLRTHVEASKPSKNSGWSRGLLKSENWGKKGVDNAEDVVTLLKEGNSYLQGELKRLKPEMKAAGDLESKWAAFEESAADLLNKAGGLPDEVAGHVQSISQSSVEIVKNMRQDPADRIPGERFLDRYLVAVHKIVDEYVRLASGPAQKDVEQALVRSQEVLERMDQAFRDELANLLQNDAINLTAEVEAIDTMLKMKGH